LSTFRKRSRLSRLADWKAYLCDDFFDSHFYHQHKNFFQNMSKKLFFLPALLLGAFLMFTPACGDSDPCKDVECGTNGNCFEGDCVCNEGFEGSTCADEWATKFVGNYDGDDNCTIPVGGFDYPQKISRINGTKVLLEKFAGTVYDVEATVVRGLATDVTAQKISFDYTTGGRTFKGSATLAGSKITGDYEISVSGTITDKCSFTWTKK
jgi:hypothetical protein